MPRWTNESEAKGNKDTSCGARSAAIKLTGQQEDTRREEVPSAVSRIGVLVLPIYTPVFQAG